MPRRIFVDDAPLSLQHLRRIFVPMQSEWDVQFSPRPPLRCPRFASEVVTSWCRT